MWTERNDLTQTVKDEIDPPPHPPHPPTPRPPKKKQLQKWGDGILHHCLWYGLHKLQVWCLPLSALSVIMAATAVEKWHSV